MSSKTSCLKSIRSILFIATIMCLMPSKLAINEWRLLCVKTPFLASIKITATSAVLAAVAIFLVYCSWPGVSAMMYFFLSVLKNLYATSIVMPCSRSLASPSTKFAKSISPRSFLAPFSWSSKIPLAS